MEGGPSRAAAEQGGCEGSLGARGHKREEGQRWSPIDGSDGRTATPQKLQKRIFSATLKLELCYVVSQTLVNLNISFSR